ncbi:MAG: hypothetical protein INH41_26430 [Myxococcaceae bacterium]|nr:hypothetical protein [Myxococcaceae bacterium]MCA3015936.1 hypothetical protein [Myxococcaceae bacterium]
MAVSDVKNAFRTAAQDRRIDVKEVDTILSSAGSISPDEERAMKDEAARYASQMEPAAQTKLREKLGEVSQLRSTAATINRRVELEAVRLSAEVKKLHTAGAATKTYGGSAIPEAVKTVVRDALAAGAIAYDVRELKPDPVYDTSHGEPELTVEGRYNPYSQSQKAVDTLAFDYTELMPKKVADDMNTPQTFNVLKGYKQVGNNQVAEFEKVTMKGNGRITELYDEASWPDTKARGPGGQKYASNFAILADGSVHAVPASRRSAAEPWRILTTASLGRDRQMLFNGHLHLEGGVVTYVGMSGRLCKLKERGTQFVDPIALLKAWGFQVAPGLKVTDEG